jgi:hypothetical protein
LCQYYYDDERAVAYKIYPVITSAVKDGAGEEMAVLVHTNIKMTNFRKEKARRTVSEIYPLTHYSYESAREAFFEMLRGKLLKGAREISEREYDQIKTRVEA